MDYDSFLADLAMWGCARRPHSALRYDCPLSKIELIRTGTGRIAGRSRFQEGPPPSFLGSLMH